MLYILTPLFCVALLCGAVFSFLKYDKAYAAVAPNDANAESKVKYTPTFLGVHATRNTVADTWVLQDDNGGDCFIDLLAKDPDTGLPLNTSSYVAEFQNGNKAYIYKPAGVYCVTGYVAFKAEIKVPAYTEYKLDFNFEHNLYKKSSGGGTANAASEFLYFGNNYDNPSAKDESSSLTFAAISKTQTAVGAAGGYTVGDFLVKGSSVNLTQTNQTIANPLSVTYTNNTNKAETYTAFFALLASVNSANSSDTKNTMSSYVEMNEQLTVTEIGGADDFGLDETSADYNGEEKEFTVQNWDTTRVALTSFTRKKINGDIETLYTYSNDDTGTVEGTNPLNGTTVIKAVKAGTYTLKFDIYYWCGAVWDSDTNDQSTKTLTFTISPKEIPKPTIAETQTEQGFTGNAISFNFSSTLSVDDWAKYVKELDKDKMTVADNGEKSSVVDKRNKTVEITHVGTYTVKFELADTENTVWADPASTVSGTTKDGITSGGTKNFTLKITAGGFSSPTLSGTENLSYNGTAKSIAVTSFDYRYIEMTVEGKQFAADGTVSTTAVSTAPTITYDTYKYWVKADGTTTETDPQDPVNYTEMEGRKNYKIKVTSAGKYTVTYKLTEEGKKSFLWADGSTDNQTATFSIEKQSVTVPKPASTLALIYNAQAQTMQIRNATNNTFESTLYTATVSGKQFAADGTTSTTAVATTPTITNGVVSVTDAGIYTVKVALSNTTDCVWASGTDNDVADKEITVTVNRAELEANITCSAGTTFSWQKKNSGDSAESMSVTVTGVLNNETVTFIYYWKQNGANKQDNDITSVTALTTSVDIPTSLGTYSAGYTFGVKLGADGANYVFKSGKDSKGFTITAAGAGLDNYVWKYTLNGGAQTDMPANKELAYTLVKGDNGAAAGVYAIILDDTDFADYYIEIDKSKFSNGYKTEFNGNIVTDFKAVGHYKTSVALKTTDSEYQFVIKNPDGTETKSSTMTIELEWQIVKGTFDLSGVKWEYTYTDSNGQKQTKDYTGAIEYDDINFAVRIKASTLPEGLTLVSAYDYSGRERSVNSYTATASKSDFSWDSSNFNDPDMSASTLTLNWEIKQKNLYTNFKYEKVQATKSDGTVVSFYTKVLNIDQKYKNFVKYEYTDSNGNVVTLQDIIDAVDMTSPKKYSVRAYVDPAAAGAVNFEVIDNGSDPTDSITTGSNNDPVYAVIDGVTIDGVNAASHSAVYDGQAHFNKLEIVSGNGVKISDFTVTYYKGASLSAEKFADGEYPVDAGEYLLEIMLGNSAGEDYILLLDVIKVTIEKKEIAIPTVGEIIFSGNSVNLADYLSESYAQNAGIISISGDCADIRNVSQSGYKARLTITDPNYKWAKTAEAEAVKYQLFAIKLFDSEVELLDDYVVELKWNVAPLTVDVTELWVKEKNGATLNLPESVLSLINAETLSVLYRYYDGAEQYVESPELKGGQSFRVEAVFDGIDAQSGNVLFINADGSVSTTSDRINYTVPQSGFAAAMGSTLNFLKANWMWIAIGAAALLFLIILICAIAHAKKKKKARLAKEEQLRLEKEEREREERRLEREERMSRMNQQQPMPQIMQMPQMMPQMPMQMPQPQPQYAPQPQAMGGMADSAQLTRIENELAAMKAAQAARELAEIKAEQAAMHSDINTLKTDGSKTQFAGISVDAMTEIMTMALKNVLVSATQQAAIPAQPAQPAQITDGSTQVPPDAVMTTVTTTKIDTTKKTAQNGQEFDRDRNRSTRSFVAPMPVDDGRVFDVGGFYKPADPSDLVDPDEEGK